MKTVAYIPIKLNNLRMPGKNLKPFGDGTPLMHFVQQTMAALKREHILDNVYVYCSNPDVKPYLLEDVEYLPRPEYLDQNEVKGTQIYEEFFKAVNADVYVLAHATSPFVTLEHVRDCIQAVQSGKYQSAFCAKKIQQFLWQGGKPINFQLGNQLRTQDIDPVYMELATPYVYTREEFSRMHSRTGTNPYVCLCSEIESIDIDYPEEFELANNVYMHMLKQ